VTVKINQCALTLVSSHPLPMTIITHKNAAENAIDTHKLVWRFAFP